MQSGFYATQFDQPPVQMPVPPNAAYNTLQEEGQEPAPEPPGLFQQMGQNLADSARSGAINQAGEMGAALGSQALQRVG